MAPKYLDGDGLSYFWSKLKALFAGKLDTTGNAYRTLSIPYGAVDSTSTSKTFTATIPGITELRDGVCMWLKNGVVTSASPCTLNVNGLGAKPIYTSNAAATRVTTGFNSAYTYLFVYDTTRVSGGCWVAYYGYDSNSNTVPAAQCETAAATAAKTATCTNFTLRTNSYLYVNVRYTNTKNTAITLNVNSTGAKPIYINGTASSASNYTLSAGSYIVFYDGTNYHFRTDNKIPANITGDAGTVNGHTVAADVPSDAVFTDTTYSDVTAGGTSGLMSGSDKTKLDAISSGAEVNQNAFSNVKVGSTTISADSKTDTLEIEAGENITITPDSTGDKVTIAATSTSYTFDGTYNASTNKAATVSTVTNAIDALDGGTIGTPSTSKTVTALSQSNGNISATFSDISITKSQVSDFPASMTPSSHTHGNIQNGGTLQSNDITIANGDKLVVTDSSDSSKVARTSIAFDGSTASKALTQKGTWESFTNNSGTVTSVTLKAGNGISLDTDNTAITTSGTRTISHADTSSQASITASDRTYVKSVTLDTYGHVTGLTTGTETVTDTTDLTQMTGTLGTGHGGTGQTSAQAAANAFINALGTGSSGSTPTDNDYFISQYIGGGSSNTNYYRRPMSALWSYISGKITKAFITGKGIPGDEDVTTSASIDDAGLISFKNSSDTELYSLQSSVYDNTEDSTIEIATLDGQVVSKIGYDAGAFNDLPYYDFGERASESSAGAYSVIEGNGCTASAACSHAGGFLSSSTGECSLAYGNQLQATGAGQAVFGERNKPSTSARLIVGIGSETSDTERNNGFAVGNNGGVYVAKSMYSGDIAGTNRKMFVVDSVTYDNENSQGNPTGVSISANGNSGSLSISVSKTGYTPVAVRGIRLNNSSASGGANAAYCAPYAWALGSSALSIAIHNHGSSAAKIKVIVDVLYIATASM